MGLDGERREGTAPDAASLSEPGGDKSHVRHCSVGRHTTDSCFYLLRWLVYVFFSSSLIKTPGRSLSAYWMVSAPA